MAKRLLKPEDLLRFVFVSDPQTRPDGREVLFQKKTIGDRNDYRTQLVSARPDGSLREWTAPELGASLGRWSPNGQLIAFIGRRGGERAQLCLLPTDGGEAAAATDLPEGDFGELRWSPDSRHIGFTFRARHPDWTEAAGKARAEKGLSTPPRITDNAYYRRDGEGFFLEARYKLYVVDVESGNASIWEEGCPWGAYSFDWAPDSNRLAVKRSFQENLWRDPEDDRILILDGQEAPVELTGQPAGYKTAVRWSPDGQWIAYLGNPDPLDHRGVGNTELFVAPASGGEPKRLTQTADLDLETGTLSDMGDGGGEVLEWDADSSGLYVAAGWHGECQIARVGLNGSLAVLTEGPHVIRPGGVSRDGARIGCVVADAAHPFEAAIFEVGPKKLRKATAFNREILREVAIAKPEAVWLAAEDGYPVHAWFMRPPKVAKPFAKLPAVLEIHGGPQAQYGWVFFFEFQLLAAAGYAVAYSNPRGSKGYGRGHVAAIAGAWGQKDWLDVAALKDWLKEHPEVDSERLGVMGGSYGGYLVNWAVGHTHDFRAAITDRCVSNLLSKALNSDYPYYPGTYWKGSGYGPLESNADLWRDSPLAYFENVETPMLIIHSEGDLRCHIEQGEQVFSALQERGIPSRMVRYPASTSHGMSRSGPPDLRIHRLKEILKWWRKRL